MKRTVLLMVATLAVVLGMMGPASAYDYPSTNDENRAAGHPHVNQVSQDIGEVTLEFDNGGNVPLGYVAFFEYRIDGETPSSCVTAHPVVDDDCIHPGVLVTGRDTSVTRTFEAEEYVEVRLALGGERDWDFDWTRFDVLADAQTKEDCKDGGHEQFGFANQGQCIQFVNTGKDARAS